MQQGVSSSLESAPASPGNTLDTSVFGIAASSIKLTSSVRIVCLSDTHAQHKYIHRASVPAGDVLVHTGDICMTGSLKELCDFAEWFGAFPHAQKILIGGNHDYCLDGSSIPSCPSEVRDTVLANAGITLLHDSAVNLSGINVYGTPWQLPYKQMAFNLDDPERALRYAAIPENTNILLTHNPPKGILDQEKASGPELGCAILRKRIDELPMLQLNVFGHIHLGRGHKTVGDKHFINASMVGGPGYSQRPFAISQQPFVVDLLV